MHASKLALLIAALVICQASRASAHYASVPGCHAACRHRCEADPGGRTIEQCIAEQGRLNMEAREKSEPAAPDVPVVPPVDLGGGLTSDHVRGQGMRPSGRSYGGCDDVCKQECAYIPEGSRFNTEQCIAVWDHLNRTYGPTAKRLENGYMMPDGTIIPRR